ncbi:hypothetical protein ACFX13_015362 [Malus domestica]
MCMIYILNNGHLSGSSNRRANKGEANYVSRAYQNFYAKIEEYNPVLEVVVTYTEELANQQAKDVDELLARGVYLGSLHGIPYGLKDIIFIPHYKTTWGSITFKDQVLDTKAWVYKRLKSAGAVLVAKLVTGSLAYDDIWLVVGQGTHGILRNSKQVYHLVLLPAPQLVRCLLQLDPKQLVP